MIDPTVQRDADNLLDVVDRCFSRNHDEATAQRETVAALLAARRQGYGSAIESLRAEYAKWKELGTRKMWLSEAADWLEKNSL